MIEVKMFKAHTDAVMPTYAKEGDAGMDLYSVDTCVLEPGKWKLVNTGLCMEIPVGYQGEIRPRSGNAVKFGVTVLNTPGTVDCGYRNEVKVCLINLGSEPININVGDRVAQMVFMPVAYTKVVQVSAMSDLTESERNLSGWGGSGSIGEATTASSATVEYLTTVVDINSEYNTVTLAVPQYSETTMIKVLESALLDKVGAISQGATYFMQLDMSEGIENIKVVSARNV